jgi:hypothetical protein
VSVNEQDGPDGDELVYRIAMVGPTRVGKTSLVTSVLSDGQRLLKGTPVTISAHGTPTERRIAQQQKQLKGSLHAGEFSPGALRGTQEWFEFELLLDPGEDAAGIRLQLLDYPGEWLNPDTRRGREAEWEHCKRFMREASVLIVPIDAAVLMEASLAAHRHAWPSILTTWEVSQVVMDWAAARAAHPDEPALLLLCPVKCETYFDDNGGTRDESAELLERVRKVYAETIAAAPGHARTVYLPVDTIGCVEVMDSEWTPDPAAPETLEFAARYRVRPPGLQTIKGADDVLVALCRHLVDARQREEQLVAGQLTVDADRARELAQRHEGFLGNFWLWLSGERASRREHAELSGRQADEARRREAALRAVVVDLAEREPGERVHTW